MNINNIFNTQNPLIITNGLVGYWGANDGSGSIVRDFHTGSSQFTNGFFTGSSPVWVSGKIGSALNFSGNSSPGYVRIPDSSYLRPGSGNWSISFWFNAPNLAQSFTPIISKRDGDTFNQIQISVGTTNAVGSSVSSKNIGVFTNSSLSSFFTTKFSVDGNWHHVVFIRPSSGIPKVYIDGSNQALTTVANGGIANINNTAPWEIGGSNSSTFLSGSVDDIRMYNRELTPDEVLSLAQTPIPLYFVNPQTSTWMRNVIAAGGFLPSQKTVTSLDTFYNDLSSASILSKMIIVNCDVPDNLIASFTPLINSASVGSFSWTNNGPFVSTDLTTGGLAGDASGKFLNTGFFISASTNIGFTWYVSNATKTGFDIGAYNGTTGILGAAQHSDGKTYSYNGSTTTNIISFTNTSGSGYFSSNRVSSTDHRLYFANSTSSHSQVGATDTTSFSSTLPNFQCFVNAENFNGSKQLPSSDRISFTAIHAGLNVTESNNFFNSIQKLRTALGGGYV